MECGEARQLRLTAFTSITVMFSDFKPIFSWLSPKRPTMSSRFPILSLYLILSYLTTFLYLKIIAQDINHKTRSIRLSTWYKPEPDP